MFRSSKRRAFLALIAMLCTVLGALSFAQSTATLVGVVKDPSGAVVSNANISAKQPSTGLVRTTTTNASGYYSIASLPVGTYDVTVTAPGFKENVVQGVTLRVDQTADVNIQISLGQVSQEVSVQGSAPMVDTTTTAVGDVVENREIKSMPLNGRHFLQLGLLVPGVSEPQQGSTQKQWGSQGGDIGFSVSGQRDSYNNFTLDGVNVMDTNYNTVVVSPSVDSVEEFKILSDGYSAKWGIMPGAQVDIITRSGSNAVHGTAYEYLRNSAVDAKNYFDSATNSIPPYKQNQFGATIGGPIQKDKLFYFVSYEGLRIRQSLTEQTVVPTEAMHKGDLSGINPSTGLPFPQITNPGGVPYFDNQIPMSDINPIASGILALTPLPNIANAAPGGPNYLGIGQHYDNTDSFLGRIDYQLNRSNLASLRYIQEHDAFSTPFVQRFSPTLPAPAGFGDVAGELGRNFSFSLITTVLPSAVNDFHFGYNSLNAEVHSQNLYSDFIQNLGFTRYGSTLNTGIPFISIPGLGVLGDSDTLQPNIRRNHEFEYRDDFTWTKGRFTHEFGGDYWRAYLNGVTDTFSNGSFNFGNYLSGFGQVATGDGFSDFLLDRPRLSIMQLGNGFGSYDYNYAGIYYAGQFRATQNLTLSYGLRWEFSTSPTPIDGTIMSVLDMQKGEIILGSQGCKSPSLADPLTQYFVTTFGTKFATNCEAGLPASVDPTRYNNLAPRFGFAWDVGGSKRLVVRGSAGIFNSFQERGYSVESGSLGPPFAPTVATFQDSLFFPTTPLTYENAFAFGGPSNRTSDNGGPSTAGIPPGVRPGYVEAWSLNLQSQLTNTISAEVAYIGNHGVHDNGFYLADQNYPNSPTAAGGFNPNPAFGESFQEESEGQSWYHGLLMQIQQRMNFGLTFSAAYTFAKSEDNVSTFTGGPTDSPLPQNSYDLGANKALSNFNAPNRFVFNYVWDLPVGKGKKYLNTGGATNAILGNWQWSGITTLQSGSPFTVQLTGNVSGIGSSSADRPNCIGNPNDNAPHTVDDWFNTSVFVGNTVVTPPGGRSYELLGTCGRNIVTGPPLRGFDTSLGKKFPFTERVGLDFRVDFFNVLNHPHFDIPNRYYGTSTFGEITQAETPRLIQFSLRLAF
jgi:hypothetical protein